MAMTVSETANSDVAGLIAASLAASSGLPLAAVAQRLEENPFGFLPRSPGPLGVALRAALLPVTRHAEPLAIALTSLAKQVRSRRAGPMPHASDLPLLQLAGKGRRGRAACVLTHDVDWRLCYESLPWLSRLESDHGLNATYHFLTEWRYRPSAAVLADLAAAGHEVGLHGRWHDAALGYRSEAYIDAEIRRALAALPTGIRSYRAPALCFSLPLAGVLREQKITSDSSMLVINRYGACAESVWPYRIVEGLWEVPLTMQDDLLFRDQELDDMAALAAVEREMNAVLDAGGVFVFNGHPGILVQHQDFARGLVAMLRDSDVPILTMSGLLASYDSQHAFSH